MHKKCKKSSPALLVAHPLNQGFIQRGGGGGDETLSIHTFFEVY